MYLDWPRDPIEFIRGAHYQAIVSVKQANNLVGTLRWHIYVKKKTEMIVVKIWPLASVYRVDSILKKPKPLF